MSDIREILPSARRLMTSLRDIGYDLPAAVADIVDNSVDAMATRVAVDIAHEGPDSWIRIADDGVGMSVRTLEEALRYGSQRAYKDGHLGRFGLGLKTASLSQCRRLTVASRTSPRSRIEIRCWDLDLIEREDRWQLRRIVPSRARREVVEPLAGSHGTVVFWDRLDRVEAFKYPDGLRAKAALQRDAEDVSRHLSLIFHRYLAGEVPGPNLDIEVNGTAVAGWDPFARTERNTERLRPQKLRRLGDGPPVTVSPYILPAQHQFSSPQAHELAAGPNRWNRQQGFYIYRNFRLIQNGGWNRLRTLDEHSKLARIAIDLPPGSETDWRLNVSKMHVSIPEQFRGDLKTIVGEVVARAQGRYRASIDSQPSRPAPLEHGAGESWALGRHWDAITKILEAELGEDPDRLDRVLERLINSRTANGIAPDRRAA